MTLPISEQVGLNMGATILRPDLDKQMKALEAAPPTWRNTGFSAPPGGGHFGAGAVNFSPGWFQRLRDVRLNQFVVRLGANLFQNSQQLDDYLYVSASLRTDSAANFLRVTESIDVISNAITALVAPRQYDYGLAAIELIKNGRHLYDRHPILDSWISVWSGFAMIVNRVTAIHRDLGGAPEDYDLLFSSGTHNACNLDVPDLGATLSYRPGTAVAITGRVLQHGVKTWEGGERICQARFIKDAVHDRLGLPRPTWVNYDDYIALISSEH
jgi:hypothetical protein